MFPFIAAIASSASNHAFPNAPTFQRNLFVLRTILIFGFLHGVLFENILQHLPLLPKNPSIDFIRVYQFIPSYLSYKVGKLYSTGIRAEKVIWSEQLHNRRYEIAIITSSASTSSFEATTTEQHSNNSSSKASEL
uniref:Uncharacterized protein n=1 Tax=Glossina palpalis gambiensis TaxID=67801 RepID=A0A1B0BEU3_9MUSC